MTYMQLMLYITKLVASISVPEKKHPYRFSPIPAEQKKKECVAGRPVERMQQNAFTRITAF